MAKHILDIIASSETHHARSANVIVKQANALKQLIRQTPITKELNATINELLEGMKDIAEIMDGYKGDMLDLLEAHRAYIVEVQSEKTEWEQKTNAK